MNSDQVAKFRKEVWNYYKNNGRNDLPWRKTVDPYRILVSEMMLQQTQVPRVVEKYKEFLRKFPTVRILAKASLGDVLKVWSGLGYNRRAKYLHDAAVTIVDEHAGVFPREYPSLRSIPGIGQYTANAVRVFAYDEPEVLIETNVRTAIIYHFLTTKKNIQEPEVEKLAARVAVGQDPREWHSALFDYGAHLKTKGIRTNTQSAQYNKQSKFEGSLRQIRGEILRELHKGPSFIKELPFEKKRIETALAGLARDGLIVKEKRKWRIA
jgi:A/G-specific adenine glycosylase